MCACVRVFGALARARQGLASEVHSGLALPLPHKVSIREGFEWTEVEPPVECRGKRCGAEGSHPAGGDQWGAVGGRLGDKEVLGAAWGAQGYL